MPDTIPEMDVSAFLRDAASLNDELLKLGKSLFERSTVMALASDASTTTDIYDAVSALLRSVSGISNRLDEVMRLATAFDRIADPQILESVG